MIPAETVLIEKFFQCILQILKKQGENACNDFEDYPVYFRYLQKISEEIDNCFYTKDEIEKFISRANQVLLKYAQHKYSNSADLTGDDILDSLITSIDFLGEELNFSTVTTHYLKDIFNSIGDMLLVVDQNGFVLFISDTTCQILGYKEEEIKSQNIQMILEPNVSFGAIVKNKKTQLNYIFNTKNGQRIPVELKLSDFARQDNPVMGQVIIARDVSVHMKFQYEIEQQNKLIKSTNEELREALKIAEQSEKLKTSFLANMSHEIRTPLNGIMGFSEYIQRPNLTSQEYARFGAIILDCSNQLLGIVNDVLDISRIESGLMSVASEPVMINKLIETIKVIYSQKIISENKEIELLIEKPLEDKESYIISDELRLRQVLSNLMDNAVKYTEKGQIIFGYNVKHEMLEFFVKDTGIGIPEDKHVNIFKPFHQAIESTTKLYGGTGLGLAIAKGLSKLLEGDLFFKSVPDVGSEFYFSLPYLKTIHIPSSDVSIDIISSYSWAGKSILIVEDDPINNQFLETVLKHSGASLRQTIYAREAIEIIRNERIDIVLMDVRLPDLDGINATKNIREFNEKIPIIAQTAYAASEDKLKCLRAGCNYYISKPINQHHLMAVIDSIIGKKKTIFQK
jgi:PAS domain S-box-containing protein